MNRKYYPSFNCRFGWKFYSFVTFSSRRIQVTALSHERKYSTPVRYNLRTFVYKFVGEINYLPKDNQSYYHQKFVIISLRNETKVVGNVCAFACGRPLNEWEQFNEPSSVSASGVAHWQRKWSASQVERSTSSGPPSAATARRPWFGREQGAVCHHRRTIWEAFSGATRQRNKSWRTVLKVAWLVGKFTGKPHWQRFLTWNNPGFWDHNTNTKRC